MPVMIGNTNGPLVFGPRGVLLVWAYYAVVYDEVG